MCILSDFSSPKKENQHSKKRADKTVKSIDPLLEGVQGHILTGLSTTTQSFRAATYHILIMSCTM